VSCGLSEAPIPNQYNDDWRSFAVSALHGSDIPTAPNMYTEPS
jgi:hypothetical protein